MLRLACRPSAASWTSPLSLLLSERADLDEKMLLASFFFSTGADLQTDRRQEVKAQLQHNSAHI